MTKQSNSNELYIPTTNFYEIALTDIIEQAKAHFGENTNVKDLYIASERFLERGCYCCRSTDDDYDLYFCIYLRKDQE